MYIQIVHYALYGADTVRGAYSYSEHINQYMHL